MTSRKTNATMSFSPGDRIVCTLSASPGYKVGEVYEVFLDDEGKKCIMGRDGFKDYMSLILSSFKREKDVDTPLTIV